MRMPNARQISEEQQDIFEDAPMTGHILISGPPGTGKTVIAFLRAKALAKKKTDVTVLMFNRVLRRYTENVAHDIPGKVASKTMHSWLSAWWKRHKILREDQTAAQNNRAMPSKTSKKSSSYKSPYGPPEIEPWFYDWNLMREQYVELEDSHVIDWGHLIIDEAQDFPSKMFKFLRTAAKPMKYGGITILADENQRLNEKNNSSLEEIRTNLNIKKGEEFRLTKNFRNTKPIAELAKHFYAGLSSGIPELPEKSGSLPKLIAVTEQNKQVSFICDFLVLRGAQEVAVIVDSDVDRKFYVDNLGKLLPGYVVQSYSSSDSKNSEMLRFDQQGVITVLNRRSCKGLEFDTVFIPDLQKFSFNDAQLMVFNMNMYVMCSRARSELFLMYVKGRLLQAPILSHLPSASSGLIEYRDYND
ncbi:AAA family ATPase [Providencia rettgeri]|uniref:AAA family ATPase n=1 Tax=Providencia rettgeri TaxID=587 RepID=A0AAD2ZII8_PRORE|nr:AAA family ATPase [Providencia rettgeri]